MRGQAAHDVQGTEISNNTFVNLGRDAWQLPISVGKSHVGPQSMSKIDSSPHPSVTQTAADA